MVERDLLCISREREASSPSSACARLSISSSKSGRRLLAGWTRSPSGSCTNAPGPRRLTGAAPLLGQIAYRAGDLQTAIRTYEDALVVAPENAQLLTTLARWRREAALNDTLDRRLSDHFTVLFEGAAEQPLADRVLHILELAFWRAGMSLSAYPVEDVTVILLYGAAVQRHHARPRLGGGIVRRHDPRAGPRRARAAR